MTLSKRELEKIKHWLTDGWPEGYVDVPHEDALLIIQHTHACGRGEAEFILAIEHGEIEGDIEVVMT